MPRLPWLFRRLLLRVGVATVLILSLSVLVKGQQTPTRDCFEIRYLDIFGLDKVEVSWPDSEIDGLLLKVQDKSVNERRFLIPIIVKQLAEYHSCIKKRSDLERFRKLTQLYLQIRPGVDDKLRSFSFTDQQLELIRRDFYEQVNDDELLHQLIYTMDDGPLQGELAKSIPRSGKPIILPTKFGELRVLQSKGRIYVAGFDKKDKLLWARILRGTVPERYLKTFDPQKIDLREFEAAGRLSFFADGERVNIYFRPNGRFLYYTHSW